MTHSYKALALSPSQSGGASAGQHLKTFNPTTRPCWSLFRQSCAGPAASQPAPKGTGSAIRWRFGDVAAKTLYLREWVSSAVSYIDKITQGRIETLRRR